MGFYPKHLRQRRERKALRLIALAALHGARFDKRIVLIHDFDFPSSHVVWTVIPERACWSTKTAAALNYLEERVWI